MSNHIASTVTRSIDSGMCVCDVVKGPISCVHDCRISVLPLCSYLYLSGEFDGSNS